MSAKSLSRAVQSWTPGPDLDRDPRPGVSPVEVPHYGTEVDDAAAIPTYLTGRIRSGLDMAAPTQQQTPTQDAFRQSLAQGRWQSDSAVGAHAQVYAMKGDGLGCVDVVRMEPVHNPDGCDYYADLGGQGARDYAARRP